MNKDATRKSVQQQELKSYSDGHDLDLNDIFDVAILGGGISGVSTAFNLQKSGKSCILLGAANIGSETSSGTTAYINDIFDTTISETLSKFGHENADLLKECGSDAMQIIESNIREYGIDCDFEMKNAQLFALDEKQAKKLEDFVDGGQKMGYKLNYVDEISFPFPFKKAIEIHNQGQFHSKKYIRGLCDNFVASGGTIVRNIVCESHHEQDDMVILTTTQGQVKAKNVVYATHIPSGLNVHHFKNVPYRSYGMAFILNNQDFPNKLGYDLEEPYRYYRTQDINGEKLLIVGGEDNKGGHKEDSDESFFMLEDYVRNYFDVGKIAFRWSSEDYRPVDGLPYIGVLPGSKGKIFAATGFGGNRITLGSLSSKIISELILTGSSKYEKLFSPSRIKPVGALVDLGIEQATDTDYFKKKKKDKKAINEFQKVLAEKIKILESIGDAFFTVTKDFTVTYWNKSAEDLIGKKRKHLIGRNLWDVFPDAVSLPVYGHFHKVLETKKPLTFEQFYGTWLEMNAYPSSDGMTVLFRDISLRKEADNRLIKALEEKNKILESIGDSFFSINKDWIVTYWNKEAEIVLGKKREDIVGSNLWAEYPEAIGGEFYRQYHKAIETGETANFEEYHPNLGKWLEVSVYPTINGLSVYFKDVTLRKEADIRLLQAKERFEIVTKVTADAIWDWDLENNIFYRISGFEKFYDCSDMEILKENDYWHKSINPDDLENIKSSIVESLNDPSLENWQMEYRIRQESGGEKIVIDKGMIIRDASKKAIRMIGAVTDVTESRKDQKELIYLNHEQKKHVQALEFTNDQLEQFAFIASHDLQEPLRMISSFLTLLQKKYENKLDKKAHQYIGFATDGARRMRQIILDLLVYSRAGKTLDEPETVNLNQLMEDYLVLRKQVIQEKSAEIIFKKLPEIVWYKSPIIQIIHCLLDNAIKYSNENIRPKIILSVSKNETDWIFKIEDNGIGIDSKFFDKIFVIFQRLHNQNEYEGTGIGLSVAKKQVELGGGKIWVESEPGKGSTFYFNIKQQVSLRENDRIFLN